MPTNTTNAVGPSLPRVGMLATVRNRRALVTAVEPFQGDGLVHNVVTVEYLDGDGVPQEDLLWEREINPRLLEPSALPDPSRTPPMPNDEFDALVRATRWNALTPFIDPDGSDGPLSRLPLTAPLHGAIQVEDFQLVPLLKALQMPRVSLLIADDVGLGKTIEAGLVLAELFNRRRIRKVLIISPASLCLQWQQEMSSKFCLSFDPVDRNATQMLRKRMGIDANPWRTYSRCVTSYHYLKQPDVLEQFLSASRVRPDAANLPWDLLIVDEAHNLMPPAAGESSDLAKMLETIAPLFEHKLFLTATPHNGYTRCFSGLLERLDPVRFSQKSEFTAADKLRIEEVVVRRLKNDINERTNPKRFCERATLAQPLSLSSDEKALSSAFQAFRRKLMGVVRLEKRQDQIAGKFAVEVLNKRLLSCPYTFAESWRRCMAGMRDEPVAAPAADVRAAKKSVDEDTDDDRERESRTRTAAAVVGSWLKPYASHLLLEIGAVDRALGRLGLLTADNIPTVDARWEAFVNLLETNVRDGGRTWKADERLIVFTEYKTTLDYLEKRLVGRYGNNGAIRLLYGGISGQEREAIKIAFNDPSDPIRVLLATDTGSEGQNLQETSRLLLHYDIPWNPSRLEQRNGRIDRHGQARDVYVCHFATDDDPDLSFLAYIVNKVNNIREDLGSTGEIFDAAFERQLIQGNGGSNIKAELDQSIDFAKEQVSLPKTAAEFTGQDEEERLKALRAEIDLSPETLRTTLEVALGLGAPGPRLIGPDVNGRVSLRHPIPSAWEDIISDSLRLPSRSGALGALPRITFDPQYYMKTIEGRPVFRPERDTSLLHLGHPIFRQVLSTFAKFRFPAAGNDSRWTVRVTSDIPDGADALLLLTVEELAVNELREPFHHWVKTIRIPVIDGELGRPLPHEPAEKISMADSAILPEYVDRAEALWLEIGRDAKELVSKLAVKLSETLSDAVGAEHVAARERELARFASRQGELSQLIQGTTIAKLEREIEELRRSKQQGVLALFETEGHAMLDKFMADKQAEISRRRQHYETMRLLLDRERKRVIDYLLPARFALRGSAQVLPVAVEIRLRGNAI